MSQVNMIAKRYITSARSRKPKTSTQLANKILLETNKNYTIILDTETTGLFTRNANPENYELFNNARIVEIAWEIYSPTKELINKESYLIKPESFVIPEQAIKIHGITNEMANNNGHNIQNVFDRLEVLLKDVSTIVAHNLSYDNAIVLAELYRLNTITDGLLHKYNNLIYDWISKEHKCTMMMSCYITGSYKWHKLNNLYKICFNEEPNGILHRAAADVDICAKVYFYLISRSTVSDINSNTT